MFGGIKKGKLLLILMKKKDTDNLNFSLRVFLLNKGPLFDVLQVVNTFYNIVRLKLCWPFTTHNGVNSVYHYTFIVLFHKWWTDALILTHTLKQGHRCTHAHTDCRGRTNSVIWIQVWRYRDYFSYDKSCNDNKVLYSITYMNREKHSD